MSTQEMIDLAVLSPWLTETPGWTVTVAHKDHPGSATITWESPDIVIRPSTDASNQHIALAEYIAQSLDA